MSGLRNGLDPHSRSRSPGDSPGLRGAGRRWGQRKPGSDGQALGTQLNEACPRKQYGHHVLPGGEVGSGTALSPHEKLYVSASISKDAAFLRQVLFQSVNLTQRKVQVEMYVLSSSLPSHNITPKSYTMCEPYKSFPSLIKPFLFSPVQLHVAKMGSACSKYWYSINIPETQLQNFTFVRKVL